MGASLAISAVIPAQDQRIAQGFGDILVATKDVGNQSRK